MDRISELPDFIAHHILSLFDTSNGPSAELVRMSVLSKTWFHLTAYFPILDFNIYKCKQLSRRSFFKYVEYTTSRFCNLNIPAHKLDLSVSIRKPAELGIVNRCLERLLRIGVKELLISVDPKYRLPDILLAVSVLTSLTIWGCEWPSSFMVDALNFKSLIYLGLESVYIGDEVIKYIITGCPLLQNFNIGDCDGFVRFCVHGHQNLQEVIIYDTTVEIVDIEAPNLTCLYLVGVDQRGPPQINLTSCKKLTSVFYEGSPIPNSNGITDFLPNFPLLKNLSLFTSYNGNNMKLSSHSLRTLELNSQFDLEEIELITPSLGLFIYSSDDSHRNGISDLPHLKACMRCYVDESIGTLWFHKLRLFLDKKNGFKALNLYICTDQKVILLEKIKEIELPPYELEHIELHFEQEQSPDHAAFVDAVLCFL